MNNGSEMHMRGKFFFFFFNQISVGLPNDPKATHKKTSVSGPAGGHN